jgi:DNA primase
VICCVHRERRPSLTVNVEKGVAYCFACDFKGTAIHLVMAMESCNKTEALERLEVILRAAGHDMKQSVRGRYQRPSEGRTAAPGRRYVPPGRRSA